MLGPMSRQLASLILLKRATTHARSLFSLRPSPRLLSAVMAQESTILSDRANGPIFFWREFEEPYGFLSQWYECVFEHDSIKYNHTEMWMMTQKAKLFNDQVFQVDPTKYSLLFYV